MRGAIAITAVAAFMALTACAGRGDLPTTNPLSYTPAPIDGPVAAAQPVGVGEPARDGKLEFVVTGLRRSASVGNATDPVEKVDAAGEFVTVALTVRNVGARPELYHPERQVLVVDGKQLAPNEQALGPRSATAINPGLAMDVELSYDVAAGAQPQAIILDGDSVAGGVTVDLA